MKKPRLAPIQRLVEKTQGDLRSQPLFFDQKDPLAGQCQENYSIARELSGDGYTSVCPSEHGPYGHTVGVVSHRGTNVGQIIDITQEEGIIGQVPDVRNEAMVGESLTRQFGFGGWARRK